ncbi:hypothetical protein CN311_19335 [Mesorhizobium sanjuanii]|uniref:Uncharacterized protein n=1 Tax=Mesorhizobium sanjuanii TaxID=2037900 RepID=A0A2A6FCV5_9HYPH|nr:hypothetical protein CN311_19335 [Mesorhizobium sanjuanii]
MSLAREDPTLKPIPWDHWTVLPLYDCPGSTAGSGRRCFLHVAPQWFWDSDRHENNDLIRQPGSVRQVVHLERQAAPVRQIVSKCGMDY